MVLITETKIISSNILPPCLSRFMCALVCLLPALPVEDVLWTTRGCGCGCVFTGGRHTPLAVRGCSYGKNGQLVMLTRHVQRETKDTRRHTDRDNRGYGEVRGRGIYTVTNGVGGGVLGVVTVRLRSTRGWHTDTASLAQ